MRPPSPPPEEEDDKDEDDEAEKVFRGPRTPEDSGKGCIFFMYNGYNILIIPFCDTCGMRESIDIKLMIHKP